MFMWQKGGKEDIQEKKAKVSFFLHHDHNFLSQVQHILYISINNNKHINIFIFILFCVDALPLNQRKCVTFCWCCCCEWICDTIRTHIIIIATCILCVYTRRSDKESRKNRQKKKKKNEAMSGFRDARCFPRPILAVNLALALLHVVVAFLAFFQVLFSLFRCFLHFAFRFAQFRFCLLIWIRNARNGDNVWNLGEIQTCILKNFTCGNGFLNLFNLLDVMSRFKFPLFFFCWNCCI